MAAPLGPPAGHICPGHGGFLELESRSAWAVHAHTVCPGCLLEGRSLQHLVFNQTLSLQALTPRLAQPG